MAEKIEQRSVSVRIDGKEITNSLKSIQQEARILRDQLSKMEEGTDAYVRKSLSLEQANEAAKKNREAVKKIADAWQAMPEEVKKSVVDMQTKLAGLRQKFEEVLKAGGDTRTPEMKALKGEITQLATAIKDTTKEFIDLKKQSAAGSWQRTEEDIKEVTAALKGAVRGSEDYIKAQKRLESLNIDLEKHKKGLGEVEDAWYKNIPAIQGFAAAAVGVFAIDTVIEYGKALFNNAKAMDTLVQKSASVLADQLGRINNEAEKHAHSFGIARQQYVGATADMSAFFQSQFATREEGAKLGNEAVKLAGILAGFKGGGAENFAEALEAIKGGFSDNVEELAKFNIALSDDIIKAAMAEKGLDKLNAKQQEHAKGTLLLALIQEKATAQIQAFGDTSGTVARQEAELLAKLTEIGNVLATILIPIFNRLASVVVGPLEALGSLVDGVEKLAQPTKAASNAFFEQSAKVKDLEKDINPLLSRYEELMKKSEKVGGVTNLNKKEQNELKIAIEKIGEAVPTAITKVDNYGKALGVNSTLAREFLETQKTLAAFLNKDAIELQENELKQITYQRDRIKNNIELANQGKLVKSAWEFGVGSTTRKYDNSEVAQMTAQLEKLSKTVDGATLNLKRLKGEPLAEIKRTEKPIDFSGESEDARQNRENKEKEEQNHLKNLREQVEKHRSDLRQQEMRDDERDAERIKEKYRQQIDEATELEKSGQSKVAKGAHEVRLQLETLQAEELEAKQVENTEKRVTKLKELETAAIAAVKGLKQEGLDKDLADIDAKFDAKIAEIRKLSDKDPNAKDAQTGAENATEAERDAAKIAAKSAFNDKLVAQITKFQDDVFQLHADDEARELATLEVKYNELIARAVKYHDGEKEIMQWYEDQKTKIHNKSAEERTKKTESETKKQADVVKKITEGQLLLEQSKLDSMKAFGDLVGVMLGDAAKDSIAFLFLQKTIAASEMYLNMGREIAGYYAAYAAIPGGPAIATALAGQAKIRTTIQVAAMYAQALVPAVQQKYDGGEVVGASDGKRYKPNYYGEAKTGYYADPSLFLTSEKGGEYVIAYPETKDPIVANFLPYLEATRQRRVRGYADGGAVGADISEASPTPSVVAGFGGQSMVTIPVVMFERFMQMSEGMMSAFERGIILGFEDVEHIRKMERKLIETRGYS